MATNLDLQAALEDANTTHVSMGQEIFSTKLPGIWQLFTQQIDDPAGVVQNNVLANTPEMREWVGARQVKSARAYTFEMRTKRYEATFGIQRTLMSRDKTGTVAKAIGDFNRDEASAYDRAVAAAFDGTTGFGPTGYDGEPLFDAAHPHVNGGAGHSNLGSSDLSHASFNTARTAVRNFRKESGEPFQVMPTHFRCGPSLEQRAKELLEAKDRIAFTSMTAAETSAAVQNATLMPNVWAGELTLLVDQRVGMISGQGYYWEIMDLSKPVKPMVLLVERRIEAIARTNMEDPHRFEFDEFLFGLEGDHVATAGMWQLAYRNKGTA